MNLDKTKVVSIAAANLETKITAMFAPIAANKKVSSMIAWQMERNMHTRNMLLLSML
jgi:hypothetical protein